MFRFREIQIYDDQSSFFVPSCLALERSQIAALVCIAGNKPSTWFPPGGPSELYFSHFFQERVKHKMFINSIILNHSLAK